MKNTLLAVALLTAFNVNAASNLIENGSFESYSVPSNTFAHIASDCAGVFVTCIADTSTWTPIAGAPNQFLEIQNNYAPAVAAPVIGTAQEGVNYAELTPTTASGIVQSFSLATATTGDLSFWIKSRFSLDSNSNAFNVLLNGSSIFEILPENSSSLTTAWTQQSFTGLSLLSGVNTLSFINSSADDIGIHLDNVVLTASVSAVPEPETYAMFLAGLGLLAFTARRRSS